MKIENKVKQKIIIDKIGFTLPIDKDKRLDLISKINNLGFYKNYKRKVYKGSDAGRYKNNYQFEVFNGITIALSLYPVNTTHNFLRVECNPARLNKEGRKNFRSFFKKLLGEEVGDKIFLESRVTRIDLTLDVYDMEPNIFIHKNRVEHSEIIKIKEQDLIVNIEDQELILTQIIGSDRSSCRITMYNKNIEQGIACDSNYQRIEIRLRNLGCSLADLSDDLLEEFEKINFFKSDFLNDKRFSKRFCKQAYKKGLNAALSDLADDNQRRCYRRYLDRYRAETISLDDKDLDFDQAYKHTLKSLVPIKYLDELCA
jgi:hypothetical protein